jgi:hypothetical protein
VSKVDLNIDFCSYEAAKFACLNWHYSKCTPKSKQVWIGVWESGNFVGVISFGRSSSPYLGDKFGLKTTECVELTRIALTKHKTEVSRIMSIAFKLLKRQSPGLRLLVSLADPMQGHTGGIYQAANWVYMGLSSSNTQYFYKNKWRNDTPLQRYLAKNPKQKDLLKKRKTPGKFKYIMPLDKEMKKKIESLSKPYPKRGLIEEQQTPSVDGGASPTPTLHNSEAF